MELILLSIETTAIIFTIRFMISQYKKMSHDLVSAPNNSSIRSDSYFSYQTANKFYQEYYDSILDKNTNRLTPSNILENFDYANHNSTTFIQNRITKTNITPRMTIVQIISIKAA